MTLPKSKFKLIERGFKGCLVLIPGWATDYRIFETLELDYNYIIPLRAEFASFTDELSRFLKEKSIRKVSLFGWSLGGFLAAGFCAKYPAKAEELILVGAKDKFDPLALEEVRKQVERSKKSYLYKFYQAFFSADDRAAYLWFRKRLLRKYSDEMQLKDLLAGLDYLKNTRIVPSQLCAVKKIRLFHGKEDRIVPYAEALALKRKLSQGEFITFSGAGHAPFLNPQFKERF